MKGFSSELCTGQEATGANCFKGNCVWIQVKSSLSEKLNIGIGRKIKHWHRLPREVVECP